MALTTAFPDELSFHGGFSNLPDDILPLILGKVLNGKLEREGESNVIKSVPVDLAAWADVCCGLGSTSSYWRDQVAYSDYMNGSFKGENVGEDVDKDDNRFTESDLIVRRPRGTFRPHVSVVLRYGKCSQRALDNSMPRYLVKELLWDAELQLADVMRLFYKPPGWQKAAGLQLDGHLAEGAHVPWRRCTPCNTSGADKRAPGDEPVVIRLVNERPGLQISSHYLRSTDASAQALMQHAERVDNLVPPGCVLRVSCSTGKEQDPRNDEREGWHFLEDIEVDVYKWIDGDEGLMLGNNHMNWMLNELGLRWEGEESSLSWRWLPEVARRIAGYDCADHTAVRDLLNRDGKQARGGESWRKRGKRVRTPTPPTSSDESGSDSDSDDPPTGGRRRRKAAVRAGHKIAAQCQDIGRGERALQSRKDMLPYAPGPSAIPGSALDQLNQAAAADDSSDDEYDADGEPGGDEGVGSHGGPGARGSYIHAKTCKQVPPTKPLPPGWWCEMHSCQAKNFRKFFGPDVHGWKGSALTYDGAWRVHKGEPSCLHDRMGEQGVLPDPPSPAGSEEAEEASPAAPAAPSNEGGKYAEGEAQPSSAGHLDSRYDFTVTDDEDGEDGEEEAPEAPQAGPSIEEILEGLANTTTRAKRRRCAP